MKNRGTIIECTTDPEAANKLLALRRHFYFTEGTSFKPNSNEILNVRLTRTNMLKMRTCQSPFKREHWQLLAYL